MVEVEVVEPVTRCRWPGAGEFALTWPQLRVYRRLAWAYLGGDPWVGERELLELAGTGDASLAGVFRGVPAFGLLFRRRGATWAMRPASPD